MDELLKELPKDGLGRVPWPEIRERRESFFWEGGGVLVACVVVYCFEIIYKFILVIYIYICTRMYKYALNVFMLGFGLVDLWQFKLPGIVYWMMCLGCKTLRQKQLFDI